MGRINPEVMEAILLVELRKARARYYIAETLRSPSAREQTHFALAEIKAIEETFSIELLQLPQYCWRSRYHPCSTRDEVAGMPDRWCPHCRGGVKST